MRDQNRVAAEKWKKRLSILLWLVGIHSFIVGIGLIAHPEPVLAYWGFSRVTENFFPAQGGVFHVLMAIGYVMAALNLEQNRGLVVFSIIVKGLATVFLFTYYFAVEPISLVLLSGIVDGLMALLIYWGYSAAFGVRRQIVTSAAVQGEQELAD